MLRRFVRHHPFINWLIVILTLGCHGFIWAFMLMKDANRLNGGPRIPLKLLVWTFLACTAVCLSAFFTEKIFIKDEIAGGQEHFSLILLVVAVITGTAMLFIVCYGLVGVTKTLRAHGIKPLPAPIVTVILTCAYMVSLPLLQHQLRRAEGMKQATPDV
ncbi:hypothetical protein [Ruficoccus sp. ZRK36]|uniref:hypothetical protein n=1 Tax=Ruficoccus sp. ZRK36 TaxID=2866311 RepID=UPI001C72F6C9|nr:hypothetical protein [Ruficoccus sp. ZRK36]QYY36128.1 hypothetical protein K0V07_01350 [Ruficoccus sp. ZRK36]